jgi:hypothetical protein
MSIASGSRAGAHALAAGVLLAAWLPGAALGARVVDGGFDVASGTGTSSGRSVVGEIGGGLSAARSSSATADLVGGLVGSRFPSLGSVTVETPAGEYVSIAFPLRPANPGVTSVLDELGPPSRRYWRLGRWSAPDSAYVEAAGGGLTLLERGRGYFLVTLNPIRVVETGLAAPIGDYSIELEDGPGGRPAYNQLGNPFVFPVAVADLLVSDGTTTVRLLDAANTLTEPSIKIYDPATRAYASDRTVLDSRAAFWVKKLAPGPVRVIVPYRAAPLAGSTSAAKPAGAHWAVKVGFEQGGRAAEPMIVGAAPVSAEGWNALCASRAPDPPGGGLGLAMRETRWGRWSGDYVRVFRRPEATMSWDFTLSGAESPGEATLAFEAFDLPAGARLVLADAREGWTREVTSGERVTIAARPDHRLTLTVTSDVTALAGGGFADGLRRIHPNPASGPSGLVFALARAGDVDVRIYDTQGRAVRGLSARASGSGERVLVWDGRDDGGRMTAPGVYLARWRAGAAHGTARMVRL